ncbi:MAG: 50S ribosomal protein L11 methyltransferase [Alphaproteobacteria bacterium]
MYSTHLKLRSALNEAQACDLAVFFAEDVFACNIFRESEGRDAPWLMEWVTGNAPDTAVFSARLRKAGVRFEEDFQIEQISPDTDWLKLCYQQFPSFTVGPFFIHGSHYDSEVPDGLTGLQIDAATAFGSGEHGTTKTCLQALLDLNAQGVCPWNVLDMGAGSGILGIAAWKLWKTPVLCVDNDPECVRVALRHAEANKIPGGAGGLTCETGDGFKTLLAQKRKPYDLVIANILAVALIEMAPELVAVTDENGLVILSGILHNQAHDAIKAYEAQGLACKKRFESGEWTTLVLRK